MTENEFIRFVKNKSITDCSIIDKENIAFALKEMPSEDSEDYRPIEDRRTSVVVFGADFDGEKHKNSFYGFSWPEGIELFKIAYQNFKDGVLACDTIWYSYEFNNKKKEFDIICPKESQDDYTRGSEGIVYIDGEAYMYGILRKVFKRTGVYKWVDITDPNKHPNLFAELKKMKENRGNYGLANVGFSAMDGFCATDIYAGGEKGDAWHYNGEKWRRIDIPANFFIHTITCAGDGKVYMAGYTGGILVGRDDSWELLDTPKGKIFGSSAYFKGVMYFSGTSGLHYLKDKKLKEYKFPKDGPTIYSYKGGCVASSKDALVACGTQQALVFDGEKWEEIIGHPVLSGNV